MKPVVCLRKRVQPHPKERPVPSIRIEFALLIERAILFVIQGTEYTPSLSGPFPHFFSLFEAAGILGRISHVVCHLALLNTITSKIPWTTYQKKIQVSR